MKSVVTNIVSSWVEQKTFYPGLQREREREREREERIQNEST